MAYISKFSGKQIDNSIEEINRFNSDFSKLSTDVGQELQKNEKIVEEIEKLSKSLVPEDILNNQKSLLEQIETLQKQFNIIQNKLDSITVNDLDYVKSITYEKNKETINSKISEIEGNISNIGNIVRKSSESIERIDKNIKTLKANQEELIQSTDMTSLEQKIQYW